MARASRLLRLRRLLRGCGMRIPKLEIITAVREPIGLTLSSVFENHPYYVPKVESLTLEICRAAVLKPRMFNSIDDWFDTELQAHTGLDVFAEPFQPEKGCRVYENRFARVLLYRFEALPRLPAMLTEFFGIAVPPLVNRNLGTAKEYAERYRFVKEHLRLPADFVSARCGIRLVRHFYSEAERRAVEERWSEREADAGRLQDLNLSPSSRTAGF
jgi:hypothetical protein